MEYSYGRLGISGLGILPCRCHVLYEHGKLHSVTRTSTAYGTAVRALIIY